MGSECMILGLWRDVECWVVDIFDVLVCGLEGLFSGLYDIQMVERAGRYLCG